MVAARLAVGLCCLWVSSVFAAEFNKTRLDPNVIPIYQALIGKSSYQNVAEVDQLLKSIENLADIQRRHLNLTDDSEGEKKNPPTDKFKRRLFNMMRKKTNPMNLPYLFQGDMVLTPEEMEVIVNSAKDKLYGNKTEIKDLKPRTLTSNLDTRWTIFPIPYTIAADVNRTAVLAGIKLWTDNTCLSFEENAKTKKGIDFIRGIGCYSNIGMQKTRQFISIGENCDSPGRVAHEFAHSLGSHHEQSRHDRDDYIEVVYDYVIQGMEGNYVKYNLEQQTDSEMLAPEKRPGSLGGIRIQKTRIRDFGAGGSEGQDPAPDPVPAPPKGLSYTNQTIYPVDPNYSDTIGQRASLSFNDVKKINFAYCNDTCPMALNCLHSGYTDPKNCNTCRCPEGFGGVLCEEVAESPPTCGNQLLAARDHVVKLKQTGNLTCYYLIQAIPGRSVNISIDGVGSSDESPCVDEYLELRYGSDIGATGARLCGQIYQNSVISETNEVLVVYKSRSEAGSFSLSYSIGGKANKLLPYNSTTTSLPTTTPIPSTTTTTIPETSEIKTTTTAPTTKTDNSSCKTETTTTTPKITHLTTTLSPVTTSKTVPMRNTGALATIKFDNTKWPFTACKDNLVNVTIPYKYSKMARIEHDLGILLTKCIKKAMIEIGKQQVETMIGEEIAPEKRYRIITFIDIDYSDLLNRIDIE
uniref:Zinc metalloproteinase n=1 Tax=Panagrellus redivivus TaxID=6233 RepID=A0A7E4VKM3_PANRE